MINDDEKNEIAPRKSWSHFKLTRKVFFLVIATILIWTLGLDEWIEYYIELGIYHYKVLASLPGIIFLGHSWLKESSLRYLKIESYWNE